MIVCLAALPGCAFGFDLLAKTVERINVEDAIRCAKEPSPEARARCIGARVASAGLDEALARAAKLGELAIRAIAPGGADDFTDAEKRRLARDLEASLDNLTAKVQVSR